MQCHMSRFALFTTVLLPIANVGCLIPYIEPAADSVIRVERRADVRARSESMGFSDTSIDRVGNGTRVLASGYDSDEHKAKLRCFLFPVMGCPAFVARDAARQFEIHLPIAEPINNVDRSMDCRMRFMLRNETPASDVSNDRVVYCGEANLPVRFDADRCRIEMNRVTLQDCSDSSRRIMVTGRIQIRRLADGR